MEALVVYESLFGNTANIAETIAGSLRSHGLEARLGPVTEMTPTAADNVDLLVVGGPTHAHGLSRASTRKAGGDDEKNQFPEPTVEPGLREWLDDVPAATGRLAAAFDTRFNKSTIITGSAAKGIAKRLEHLGFRLAVAPESFFVTKENMLVEGQIDHAGSWAAGLAERVMVGATT